MAPGPNAAPSEAARREAPRRRKKRAANAPATQHDAEVITLALERQRKHVKQLLDRAKNTAAARTLLAEALTEAAGFPDDHVSRSYILQLREKAGESKGISAAWEALFREHPEDRTVLQFHMRRLVRDKQQDKALALLEGTIPSPGRDYGECLARAELLDTIQAYEASDAAFGELLARYDRREARISWAKRLVKRGLYEDAGLTLEPVAGALPEGGKAASLLAGIEATRAFFRGYEDAASLRGADFRVLAMKHAVLSYRGRIVAEEADEPLRVTLVTGSLGAGGAERQLSRLAAMIQRRVAEPGGGIERVDVLVKEHHPDRGGDFFLGDLVAAGVPVRQANDLPPIAVRKQAELAEELVQLADLLPPQVHYGVVRMTPLFRESQPHVVSLWQDGACLYGALAALMAGVPRIQLVFRGLPPNIRANRHKPEYEILFKALAQVPGVEFMSNSRVAAREYARWLGLPEDRITILWNAVPMLTGDGRPEDEAKWLAFESETGDASETIGGVFRFEPDKRPLLWIRMAGRYLRRRPQARFVIVGAGQQMDEARELAGKLGLSDRLLFAGTSSAVGYWYARMDVKVLLSRFEGLPNVLIEAQQLGTPVVSTPAGGAEECFDEGASGHILDCAVTPCLDQACDRVEALVERRRQGSADLAEAARTSARRFDVDIILGRFLAICRGQKVLPEGNTA